MTHEDALAIGRIKHEDDGYLDRLLAHLTDATKMTGYEKEILAYASEQPPVWATARGFAQIYTQCQDVAKRYKPGELWVSPSIGDKHHVVSGHLLSYSHVITMKAEQVMALPALEGEEFSQFAAHLRLPFNPLFLDFSGDGQTIPGVQTSLDARGEARLVGALCTTYAGNPDAVDELDEHDMLAITPFFALTDSNLGRILGAFGSLLYSQAEGNREAFYIGSRFEFENGPCGKVMLAISADTGDINDGGRLQEASEVLETAALRVIDCLYLFESANVEIVPGRDSGDIHRRDVKRADKRGWKIPQVVRVVRPAKRSVRPATGSSESRNYTHQFDVVGHFKHFTKGAHVRCPVCLGNTDEESDLGPCIHCNGTGMDPKKITPCHRVDVATGEKTCPHGCRKEWCPPYVAGPTDKPYIPKTRVLR